MITSTNSARTTKVAPEWQVDFLQMLPAIQDSAAYAFRYLAPEEREEAIQDVTVGAMIAFRRLAESDRIHLAYPRALARFGIAQYFSGRHSACRVNVRDVSSAYAQRNKRFRLERLDHYCPDQQSWKEVLLEDRRACPADIATARIDFQNWLVSLSERSRKIADLLAAGESTSDVAEMFQISLGRVSQIRRELERSWRTFQGEIDDPEAKKATSVNKGSDACAA